MSRRQTATGMILLIVGTLSLATNLGGPNNDLIGALFLALLATGFAVAYARHPRHWWAIIPAGVLFTLALVAGMAELVPNVDEGPFFFAGLAATFGYLYTLPQGAKRWAIYPALAALALAILSGSFTGGWLLPLLLIGGGVYLYRRRSEVGADAPDSPDAAPGTKVTEVTFLERPSWEEVVEDLKEPKQRLES